MNAAVSDPKLAVAPIESDLAILENRLALTDKPIVVASLEHYRDLSSELAAARTISKRIEDKRLELTRPLDAAKAGIKAFFDKLKQRPDAIVSRINLALDSWDRKQRELAAKAQEEADEAARREREFNERRAARAVERGEFEAAQELQAQAAQVVAPKVSPKIPDVKGVAVRTNWTYDVVDPALVPREYLILDTVKIGQVVRAMKGDTNIPGIKAREQHTRAPTGR